jgi:hypothetical protein
MANSFGEKGKLSPDIFDSVGMPSLFFRAISHNLLLVVLWFDPDTLSAF